MEVRFRTKTKRRAASRQGARRPFNSEEDGAVHGNDKDTDLEHMQCDIKALQEDQRLREQVLKAEFTRQKAEKAQQEKKRTSRVTRSYGLHDPKKDGSTNQKLLTLLDGQFTGQRVTTDKDPHEELLNQFIEERLQKKRKLTTKEDGDAMEEAAKALKSAEDQLFELPDHLKPDVVSSGTKTGYEDGTEGGMLMGSAGIAEVELPTSYSERTEKATRMALEASKGGGAKLDAVGGLASSGLPANFSVDFNRHRTDYVAEMKSLNKDERRERGFHQVGKNQASDDRAVARFRKLESRQMRR